MKRIGMLTSGGDCQALNATMRGVVKGLTNTFKEVEIYGFITFYAMLSDKPRGRYIIRMCKSAPCHIVGAQEVAQAICDCLGVSPGETTSDGMFTLEFCECIGLCDTSPAIMINDAVYTNLTPQSAVNLIKAYQQGGAR